jgi:hypothetical protein
MSRSGGEADLAELKWERNQELDWMREQRAPFLTALEPTIDDCLERYGSQSMIPIIDPTTGTTIKWKHQRSACMDGTSILPPTRAAHLTAPGRGCPPPTRSDQFALIPITASTADEHQEIDSFLKTHGTMTTTEVDKFITRELKSSSLKSKSLSDKIEARHKLHLLFYQARQLFRHRDEYDRLGANDLVAPVSIESSSSVTESSTVSSSVSSNHPQLRSLPSIDDVKQRYTPSQSRAWTLLSQPPSVDHGTSATLTPFISTSGSGSTDISTSDMVRLRVESAQQHCRELTSAVGGWLYCHQHRVMVVSPPGCPSCRERYGPSNLLRLIGTGSASATSSSSWSGSVFSMSSSSTSSASSSSKSISIHPSPTDDPSPTDSTMLNHSSPSVSAPASASASASSSSGSPVSGLATRPPPPPFSRQLSLVSYGNALDALEAVMIEFEHPRLPPT